MDHMDHMDLAQLAIRRLIVAEAYHEHQLNELLPARGEPARVDAEREPRDVIVVGCDGSPGSRIAAHWAAEEARLLGRTLRLVSVWRRHLSLQPPLAGEDAAEIQTAAWGTLEEVAGQLLFRRAARDRRRARSVPGAGGRERRTVGRRLTQPREDSQHAARIRWTVLHPPRALSRRGSRRGSRARPGRPNRGSRRGTGRIAGKMSGTSESSGAPTPRAARPRALQGPARRSADDTT